MKENNELERSDIIIDRDMDVDCDIGQEITCYIETWFDVDKKFGVNTADDDGTWLNMYGKYNPFEDTLRIECEISHDDKPTECFDYQPTPAEEMLIKALITEKIQEEHGQTPREFCEFVAIPYENVYVYQNHRNLSMVRIHEQHSTINDYLESHKYWNGGSTSIALPMSMAGEHFRDMLNYCESRGISKIIVESERDIGNSKMAVLKVVNEICDHGLTLEIAKDGMVYSPAEENQEPVNENISSDDIKMGGM